MDATTPTPPPCHKAPMPNFDSLPLRPELLLGVERLGWTELTDIQAQALPAALAGQDLIGHARTGSGKTAVFGLAALQGLDLRLRRPQALVVCPTRELAAQVVAALRAMAAGLDGVRVLAVTGGSPSRDQRDALQAGAHVVVGTPGRLLQQVELGRLDPSSLRLLVLDEADRLLDMGFLEQVQALIDLLPTDRQTLFFSATWPAAMEQLSGRVQRDPSLLGAADLVDGAMLQQQALLCAWEERDDVLVAVLAAREPGPTVVFCETRAQCKQVAGRLRSLGAAALALHGELSQSDRDEVLIRFRNGTARVLVATNVAARGLDVDDVALVVCYELSDDPDLHIHRVGRTARAEAQGEAVALVAGGGKELRRLEAVDERLGVAMPRSSWEPQPPTRLERWASDWRTLVVIGGRGDKLRAGDLLGALTRGVGLEGSDVGDIALTDRRTWVAVRAAVVDQAWEGLNAIRIKKKRYRVHRVA